MIARLFRRAIPSGETRDVEVAKLWYVRWTSRYDRFAHDTREEVEAFPDEDDAEAFAQALRNAFKLLRHTSQTEVAVTVRILEK